MKRQKSVVPLKLGYVHAFLIRGEKGCALVDTGPPSSTIKISQWLNKLEIKPRDISIIIITHGHYDHFGSVDKLRSMTKAPVAIHADDASALRKGKNQPAVPRTLLAKLFASFKKQEVPGFTPFEPDIIIGDELKLDAYGINGMTIHTPGHTPGSVSVVLSTGECIVGDLLMGKRAHYPMFLQNMQDLQSSLKRVLAFNPSAIHVGHGGPLSPAEVRRLLREGN